RPKIRLRRPRQRRRLQSTVSTNWDEIEANGSVPRPELLQEVLSESSSETPSPHWWKRYFAIAAAAAAVAIVFLAYQFLPTNLPTNEVIADKETNPEAQPAENDKQVRIPLSQRLLTQSDSFRSADPGLSSVRENRERRAKLRTNQHKS
ncbi:MAG: hypothetical protein AAGB46_18990, partial [Verrucomicrobiota bacterium]